VSRRAPRTPPRGPRWRNVSRPLAAFQWRKSSRGSPRLRFDATLHIWRKGLLPGPTTKADLSGFDRSIKSPGSIIVADFCILEPSAEAIRRRGADWVHG